MTISLCDFVLNSYTPSNYLFWHSPTMNPRELLKELMATGGDTPSSLAAKLNHKTKQPQIYKFLEGISKEPRRSTLQPIADYYGVDIEAFYNASIARKTMDKLKGSAPRTSKDVEGNTTPPDYILTFRDESGQQVTAHIEIKRAVKSVADFLEQLPDYDKDTAISLLTTLALSPKMHDIVAEGLNKLTPEPRGAPSNQMAPAKKGLHARTT